MGATRLERLSRNARPMALVSAVATLLAALFVCLGGGPAGPGGSAGGSGAGGPGGDGPGGHTGHGRGVARAAFPDLPTALSDRATASSGPGAALSGPQTALSGPRAALPGPRTAPSSLPGASSGLRAAAPGAVPARAPLSAPEADRATYVVCPYDGGGCSLFPSLSPAVLSAPPLDPPLHTEGRPPRFDVGAGDGAVLRPGVRPRAPDLHVLQVLRT
ncbi:hypothetical protein GCM10010305_54470 [Streptomyces termitum]|uniref:Uncharacterized protein n=1 Tax=Streptomyces termitum TaxID=67368 RepID=A0A918TBL4_9ACTN|nr:hypothetical protein GCM10010305_54470 [Streptomyces termitum]